jgi:3-deoxy-7-phosphoheptulonate synthase
MIIVRDNKITPEDKSALSEFLEANHFKVNEIVGEEETIIGAVGIAAIDPRRVEILRGVKRVIPISKPYKMASREFKAENTVVEVPNNRGQVIRIGGRQLAVIAGPCAVESREQMMAVAHKVALSGAVMLRGGAFKPRTSPYAFQGLGEEGVKLLKEAGDAFGLPVVTEVVSAEHLPLMSSVDVFQIGARNMQNFELLKRVGELGKPVLLKRGISATIEELLMAAEYLLSSGTDKVILCERGIRTYEKATRNTLDLSAIPILRGLTHLPVIVDPSHAVGIRDKVPPMGLAAVAAGADGLIVEVHCDPDRALSDGAQSLFPEQFDNLMRDIDVLAPVVGKEVAHIRKAPAHQTHATAEKTSAVLPPTVAFCGTRGAFAQQAIHRFFGPDTGELAMLSFRDAFQAVSTGAADFAMIPVENSLAGSVYENYDNLWRFDDLCIAAAATLRVEHSLLAVKGATFDTIRRVYSHPHGFPQCRDFLDKHSTWELIEASSTADAAVIVAKLGTPENAAIASGINAKYNDLVELESGIESDKRNFTRFVVVASKEHMPPLPTTAATGLKKASVIFVTKNVPGALYECLGHFHHAGLNLSRLESRPIPGEPWRHSFYADVLLDEDGNAEQEVADVLTAIRTRADEIRLLGIYSEREC